MTTHYWVWIDGAPGVPPHRMPGLLAQHPGFESGHSFATWATALAYLRAAMRAGFICRVYQTEEN